MSLPVKSSAALPAHVAKDQVVLSLMRAEHALGEAVLVDQVKLVMNIAAAQEVFAKRQQLGEEVIGFAHAIKVRALARLGELLRDIKKNVGAKGSRVTGDGREPVKDDTATLADLGVSKKVSSVAQQLAALPAPMREAIAQREQTLAQARRQQSESAVPIPAPRPGRPSNGMQFARIAIMKLEEIRDDDAERQEAFALVRSWLDAREA